MPVIPEPYAPAADELGIPQEQLLAHLERMQERRLLRRVAAILFHRRAGFSANGMGVWKVPDERIMELGPRMAAFRGISHCYQRPTYADWPYSVFTMAHGRSKEECDAILDSIAEPDRHQRARDALLLDRVQEDPAALLHGRLPGLGTRARGRVSAPAVDHRRARPSSTTARSDCSPAASTRPCGRCASIGRDPIFIASGTGSTITDVDGNDYIDWVCSWGPLILGHAHPEVVAAVTAAAARGTTFGAPTEGEVELAEEIAGRIPSVEMLRMTSSGTEATMSAIRLARAVTGREQGAQVRRRLPRPRRRAARRGRLGPRHPGHPGQPRRAPRRPPPRP